MTVENIEENTVNNIETNGGITAEVTDRLTNTTAEIPHKKKRKNNNYIKKSGLDEIQKKIAYDIAMIPLTRETYQDIADRYEVGRSSIWRWRTTPEFNSEVNKYIKEVQKSQLTDAVKQLNIILNHGKDKDKLKAIELIYKNLGLLKDVTENTTTIKEDININTIIDDLLL